MFKDCPGAGSAQVNLWTWGTTNECKRRKWSADQAREYLYKHSTHTGAEAEEEIERAIDRVFQQGVNAHSLKWPALDQKLRREIVSLGPDLKTIRNISPRPHITASEALGLLFPENPLLWAARSVRPEYGADTRRACDWMPEADQLQFIVPTPMVCCDVPDGGYSKRCAANTGPRRYQVLESDFGPVDEQIPILWYLARFAPLCAIVLSGGKSAHGWYNVGGRQETANRLFMERAVSLGADRATWCRAQAVRMPGGFRPEEKTIQEIAFFSPLPAKGGGVK